MNFREVFLLFRRYAGHSKWQNIKHTKALKDNQKSLLYVKLCQRIKVAIQENGNNGNPISNQHLAQAIETAKKNEVPMSTIQSCIKSTLSITDKDAAKPCRLSIKGPRGSIILITALTNSSRKFKHELHVSLKKIGGIMSEHSLEGSFHKKGIIIALPPPDIENIEETSVDHAIEAGAEEVSPLDDDKKLTFTCEVPQLHSVKLKLLDLKYTVDESKISFIPKMKVSLNDDEMELMSKIIAKVETIPEVVDVHDNIE